MITLETCIVEEYTHIKCTNRYPFSGDLGAMYDVAQLLLPLPGMKAETFNPILRSRIIHTTTKRASLTFGVVVDGFFVLSRGTLLLFSAT